MKLRLVALLSGILAAVPAQAQEKVSRLDISRLVDGNTDFALDLYTQLRKQQDGNQFFSPYSISTALAMTYAGARGQTADQMQKTLHFIFQGETLHPVMSALMRRIDNPDRPMKPYQLSVANALWGQKGYPFLDPFIQLNKKYYGAGLKDVDFIGNTDAARKEINDWVEHQTKEKIRDLLKPGILNPNTRMVLTNAIYFKGNWDKQFKKDATKDGSFHLLDGNDVTVPMMKQTGKFRYGENANVQVLEMPYVGGDISMVILLPKRTDGLPDIDKMLNVKRLGEWLTRLEEKPCEISIPRFTITTDFQLKKTLSDLGMPLAFSDSQADFTGIADGKERLFLQEVVHKAFVDVNEEGTEAGAASGVAVGTKGGPPPTVWVFDVDHPCLFVIRDTRTDSILFMGRLLNPKK
jgi:serpin B